jgi:GNAT superfamily N-acetyltransferase
MKTKNITLKSASIGDIPALLDLIRRSKSHFHRGKDDYVESFVNIWGPRAYYIEDNILLIAYENNTPIGIIGMRAPTHKRNHAELDLLFIDSPYIGQGYGRCLWEMVLDIASKQGWQELRFISDNIPQIVGFYHHMGAKSVETLTLATGVFPVMSVEIY